MINIGDKDVWFEDVVLHYSHVLYNLASDCIVLVKSINMNHIVRHVYASSFMVTKCTTCLLEFHIGGVWIKRNIGDSII
jgi:hypothetical protein